MSRSPPFSKKQSSQYQRPEFYWRGGDSLRESEYLADEFKKAMVDFRKADAEMKKVESEIAEATESLREREGYSSALASYLDTDSEAANTEQEYKRKLSRLEQEIKEAEADLQEARAVHHPSVLSSLQKEKAYLMIEIQRALKAISMTNEQHDENQKQLSACMASPKYQKFLELEHQYIKANKKKSFLRSQVNQRKKEFDSANTVVPVQAPDVKDERTHLLTLLDLVNQKERLIERRNRRNSKWRLQIDHLFDHIQQLNNRFRALGMNEDIVDIQPLNEKYRALRPDPMDEPEAEEDTKEQETNA